MYPTMPVQNLIISCEIPANKEMSCIVQEMPPTPAHLNFIEIPKKAPLLLVRREDGKKQ